LPFSRGKGAEDIHSTFCIGLWGKYGVKLFLFLMDKVTMLLTRYAFFDEGVAIHFHSWPEVAGFEYSRGHGSCVGVISAYAFIQFSYYGLCLFCCDAFEK